MMCIRSMIDALYDIYLKAGYKVLNHKSSIQSAYKSIVNNMRCFFKNPDFSKENEYRFIMRVPERYLLNLEGEENIKNHGIKTGMFKRRRTLIPYIDMEISKKSVVGIVMNPSIKRANKNGMIVQGIQDLLWRNGIKNAFIYYSGIEVRDYG